MDKNVFIAPSAVVEGDVTLGNNVSVWHGAVIRADMAPISVGDNSNVQEGCVLHVDYNCPVSIGCGVTIGHGAIIHGCEIGDNSLIGMGAIILNGAKIGKNCIVGAGALVTGGTVVEDGTMMLGSPAKPKRQLRDDEIEMNRKNAEEYVALAADRNK